MSVDPRRTQPFCDARCYRECRCSRWPAYRNRFGYPVSGSYSAAVLGYGPIAYWPLWEDSGIVAHCLVNPAQNGTYSSDVSTWPIGVGIGDGNTAPQFDGVADFCNIYTPALVAAFNGAEGSVLSWQRVANAGVWTDAVDRFIWDLRNGVANQIYAYKTAANNRWDRAYAAGGVNETRTDTPFTSTDWWMQVITWSKSADEVRYYCDGAWQETDTVLGVWAGALVATSTIIGARFTTPSGLWDGSIAHVAVWDRALSATEIAGLAVV